MTGGPECSAPKGSSAWSFACALKLPCGQTQCAQGLQEPQPTVSHRIPSPSGFRLGWGNRALDASQYTAWQHLAWPFGNQPAQAPLTNVSPHLLNVAVRRSTSCVTRSSNLVLHHGRAHSSCLTTPPNRLSDSHTEPSMAFLPLY